MMSPSTRRNIILIASAVLLVLFLWLLFFLLPKTPKPSVSQKTDETSQDASAPVFTTEQLQKEKENRAQTSSLTVSAKLFVERYGSYSNESAFENIRDVLPLMSNAFADATQKELAEKKAPTGSYGITTRVISVKVVSQDENKGTAVIDLSTQRVEENGSAQNRTTKYQDVELTFVKESGVWLVDSVKWQ